MILSRFFSILLVLSLTVSLTPKSASAVSPETSVSSAALAAQEDQLVHEIDRQADAVFEELKRQQPDLPITLLKKTQREAIYRLRQMHVITDVLKASGPKPAIALVAGEILTNFIIAPMFAAKGNLLMATASAAIPWGIMAAGAVAAYDMMKLRLKLAKDLNSSLRGLREADKVREIVIGYDAKYRVSTVMFEMMKDSIATELEFEVVKKMKAADATRTPFVTVGEIEALVKSTPEGSIYLQRIYFERLDKGLYTALMLRYLNDDAELAERLLELLKARAPLLSVEAKALRDHLLGVDDLKKLIARDLRTIQAELKALKTKKKAGEMTEAQAAQAKVYLQGEIKRLQGARKDVVHHEYALLLDVKGSFHAGDVAAVESIAREYTPILAELEVSSRHVPLNVATLAPPSKASVPAPVASYGPRQCMNIFAPVGAR
jgi:hypothetical protein